MKPIPLSLRLGFPLILSSLALFCRANDTPPAGGKTFIDYFQPTPIIGWLSKDAWGAATVGPRDQKNGLEDPALAQWNYWDGHIIKSADGKYHFFGSRWEQAKGHSAWGGSKAIHAVADNLYGPYVDKGVCWPGDEGGKGHNVEALVLPDGRYAIVVSETRPGEVFVSSSPDGPWQNIGKIKVAKNEFSELGRMSNVCPLVRPDGSFEIIARSGAIWISKDGILGPYTVQGPSIYAKIAGLDQHNLEDPTIWYSGGLYHVLVNSWSDRQAFHLTSPDGVKDWTYRGLAYDPRKDFIRYTDGTVNHWNKLERPSVYLENGHVVAVTLAVVDVPKEEEKGNDGHGSKIVIIPSTAPRWIAISSPPRRQRALRLKRNRRERSAGEDEAHHGHFELDETVAGVESLRAGVVVGGEEREAASISPKSSAPPRRSPAPAPRFR